MTVPSIESPVLLAFDNLSRNFETVSVRLIFVFNQLDRKKSGENFRLAAYKS